MSRSGPRVVVAIDPFMLQSAVDSVFSRDPRLDAHVVPAGADPVEHARAVRADVLVVSEPVDAPDLLVVRVRDQASGVDIARGADRRVVPYTNVRGLVDLVLSWLATPVRYHHRAEGRTLESD